MLGFQKVRPNKRGRIRGYGWFGDPKRKYDRDYRPLIAYWWFVGWDCISLGFHVCFGAPNIEIHLPFGFIRIGRKQRMRI